MSTTTAKAGKFDTRSYHPRPQRKGVHKDIYSDLNFIDTAEGSSADVQESRSLAPINVGSSKKRLKLSLTKLKKVATGKENCARFDF